MAQEGYVVHRVWPPPWPVSYLGPCVSLAQLQDLKRFCSSFWSLDDGSIQARHSWLLRESCHICRTEGL